jgi:hypothetical protein
VSRHPRIEFAGAVHHVMAREDRREEIFGGERDRWNFLGYLAEGAARGEGFLRKLKDQWNQEPEWPKN